MKRELKKMTLSRETLHLLTGHQMEAAFGGQVLTYTCRTVCSNGQVCCG